MKDAFTYSIHYGVIDDRLYPYEGVEGSEGCKKNLPKLPVTVEGFVELQNVTEGELEQAVRQIGPISAAIDASWLSMQFYEHGVYIDRRCSAENINHAVLIVGYGVHHEFGPYWIVKVRKL